MILPCGLLKWLRVCQRPELAGISLIKLFSSGTAPAANYGEAHSAESKADFIHKMRLSLKELRETRVWLLTVVKSELVRPATKLEALIDENNQLISIFVASIGTARKK